jgi:hypothetical protein
MGLIVTDTARTPSDRRLDVVCTGQTGGVGIRQTVVNRLAPEVHRIAPRANSNVIQRTVQLAIEGAGPLPGAAAAAEKALAEADGDVRRAIRELTMAHVRMAGAQGFATNLGGLVTMAATIPLNLTGLALLQSRLAASIAHLRGYDLTDARVRNAVLLCTLGEDVVQSLVKGKKVPGTPMVVATAPAHDPSLDGVIAAEVTSALVSRVIGRRAAATVVRRVPVAGGVWGGSTDAYATYKVGRYAERQLKQRPGRGGQLLRPRASR